MCARMPETNPDRPGSEFWKSALSRAMQASFWLSTKFERPLTSPQPTETSSAFMPRCIPWSPSGSHPINGIGMTSYRQSLSLTGPQYTRPQGSHHISSCTVARHDYLPISCTVNQTKQQRKARTPNLSECWTHSTKHLKPLEPTWVRPPVIGKLIMTSRHTLHNSQ